jgi:signal transduction histidine kinase
VLGVLGLRVLGQSNDRVERLGVLQRRATAYRALRTQVDQLRTLLALRAGGEGGNVYVGGGATSTPSARRLASIDTTVRSTMERFGTATRFTSLGFAPPARDRAVLRQIAVEYDRFSTAMAKIVAFDGEGQVANGLALLGSTAEPLSDELRQLTSKLVVATQDETDALIAQNRSSFASSQQLFVTVAAGSVALALALGVVLAWALIGPIQRVEARVASIADGDLSGRVDVANRDELGALGANVNRMGDELKRVHEELETVSRHKSEFLANMSHELRTPLNAIIGFSEVLDQQMFGPLNEQQAGYVRDVLDAGRHLLSLINDILDLAKVEAGRMNLDLAEVSIPEVLRSGLAMHAERAVRADVALELSAEPGDIVVVADERKVRQIVFNLLSNAVKFTPPGGRVVVRARLDGGIAEVTVTDTGPGIAPEEHDLIFEEFQQASRSGAGRPGGTGLGLPLSRRFVELHGGGLWVESALGAGSTFRFTLPVGTLEGRGEA